METSAWSMGTSFQDRTQAKSFNLRYVPLAVSRVRGQNAAGPLFRAGAFAQPKPLANPCSVAKVGWDSAMD